MHNKINVLVVDDSAVVRQSFKMLLEEEKTFEVVTASDPLIADNKMNNFKPNVIVLDLEMPRMDGLTYLKKIMKENPIPVVICSSQSGKGSQNAFKALENGAVEIIEKPKIGAKEFLEESKCKIVDVINAASGIKLKTLKILKPVDVSPKLTADAVLHLPKNKITVKTEKIIVIGSSTGGTEALTILLKSIPDNMPPILIVQHMPEHFTKTFAQRLDSFCQAKVVEAVNNQEALKGCVYVARGSDHMLLKRINNKYMIEVKHGPLVSRHRPSVDVLFRSAARYAGHNAIGVILTGMGDDGARGMLEMKEVGSYTIAQDENSCIVYGMPKEAVKRNAVELSLPLEEIAGKLVNLI